ncbi:MAG TPA: radical SAM family heme chaperone HemW [Clostridiaceae bacterium]
MTCKALYIHIPFCKSKCIYCDFNSYSKMENLMEQYSLALAKEINNLPHELFDTIYIGGGTPTYLSLSSLNIIFEEIDKLNKAKDIEFTIEANPGTVDEAKLEFLIRKGVNRISIGVQAFQNNLLKTLGRIHNTQEALDSFHMARRAGFNNINIDLMFGIPKQTSSNWKESLDILVALKPEHVSCYSLIIEEETPLYNIYNEGKLLLPKEEEERAMYHYAIDFLKSCGYNQYEISNFASNGFESIHNIKYWELEEYYGCGAGAHSYINKIRYMNYEKIEEYINAKESKIILNKNSELDEIEEFMFMGLRKTTGISKAAFTNKFNLNIEYYYKDVIKKHVKNKLLHEDSNRIYLSNMGMDLSNIVMVDFLLSK